MTKFNSTGVVTSGRGSLNLPIKPNLILNCMCHSSAEEREFYIKPTLTQNKTVDIYRYRPMNIKPETTYLCELFDPQGHLKWKDTFRNLVTTEGRNKLIDATFKTGLATPAWHIGLVNNDPVPVYANEDVMASHAGWVEFTNYAETARPTFTPGAIAAGSVDNSASKALFTISAGGGTIAGCFITTIGTKGGTTGVLYGVGGFEGTRPVEEGDTMRVTSTIDMEEV